MLSPSPVARRSTSSLRVRLSTLARAGARALTGTVTVTVRSRRIYVCLELCHDDPRPAASVLDMIAALPKTQMLRLDDESRSTLLVICA